jgi:hypothetical protein
MSDFNAEIDDTEKEKILKNDINKSSESIDNDKKTDNRNDNNDNDDADKNNNNDDSNKNINDNDNIDIKLADCVPYDYQNRYE